MSRPLFTPEQVEFIKIHIPGRDNQELTELINKHFGMSLTCSQIKSFKKNRKLSSGLSGEATQFKKGQMPHNYKPIGFERVNGDGYVDIKIQDGMAQKNWRGKHLLVWEAHHGRPVPPGHAVIFGDGNRRNFDPDNLILVSRKQLAVLNKKSLIQSDAELTRTGIVIADIYSKISERKKPSRKGLSIRRRADEEPEETDTQAEAAAG